MDNYYVESVILFPVLSLRFKMPAVKEAVSMERDIEFSVFKWDGIYDTTSYCF